MPDKGRSMEARAGRIAVGLALGLVFGLGAWTPGAAQERGSYFGFNVSEPYSSTAFGFDGRWVFGDGRWAVSGFGSAFTVGDVGSGAWLGEALLTRGLGDGPLTRTLYAGAGLRLSGAQRSPTELALPVFVGFRTPVLRAGGWEVGLFGHIGVARRQAGGEVVYARADRLGIELARGRFHLGISHDDAAGSNTPFHYGGAVRLSIGLRVR
ncbi:MAG: hypothetical protein AMXMBFR53_45400 [Gemmatimonadota bacterium]